MLRRELDVRLMSALGEDLGGWDGPCLWALDLGDESLQRAAGDGRLMPKPRRTPEDSDSPAARQHRLAVAAARQALAEYLKIDSREVVLTPDAHGRLAMTPSATQAWTRASSLDFNIAHAGSVLAIGLTPRGRIGVDVELMDQRLNINKLAPGNLCVAELRAIQALPPAQRTTAFLRRWTAKEAFVKAIGLGVSFGLDQVETADDGCELVIRGINESRQLAQGWQVMHYMVRVGGKSALIAAVVGD